MSYYYSTKIAKKDLPNWQDYADFDRDGDRAICMEELAAIVDGDVTDFRELSVALARASSQDTPYDQTEQVLRFFDDLTELGGRSQTLALHMAREWVQHAEYYQAWVKLKCVESLNGIVVEPLHVRHDPADAEEHLGLHADVDYLNQPGPTH